MADDNVVQHSDHHSRNRQAALQSVEMWPVAIYSRMSDSGCTRNTSPQAAELLVCFWKYWSGNGWSTMSDSDCSRNTSSQVAKLLMCSSGGFFSRKCVYRLLKSMNFSFSFPPLCLLLAMWLISRGLNRTTGKIFRVLNCMEQVIQCWFLGQKANGMFCLSMSAACRWETAYLAQVWCSSWPSGSTVLRALACQLLWLTCIGSIWCVISWSADTRKEKNTQSSTCQASVTNTAKLYAMPQGEGKKQQSRSCWA